VADVLMGAGLIVSCFEDNNNTFCEGAGEKGGVRHTSNFYKNFFKLSAVKKILWPPRSPVVNAIERAGPWLRHRNRKHYPPSTRPRNVRGSGRKRGKCFRSNKEILESMK
jgi:hypothetical protein